MASVNTYATEQGLSLQYIVNILSLQYIVNMALIIISQSRHICLPIASSYYLCLGPNKPTLIIQLPRVQSTTCYLPTNTPHSYTQLILAAHYCTYS
jgi:hypothetical protein